MKPTRKISYHCDPNTFHSTNKYDLNSHSWNLTIAAPRHECSLRCLKLVGFREFILRACRSPLRLHYAHILTSNNKMSSFLDASIDLAGPLICATLKNCHYLRVNWTHIIRKAISHQESIECVCETWQTNSFKHKCRSSTKSRLSIDRKYVSELWGRHAQYF
jgi:hypothetical protein